MRCAALSTLPSRAGYRSLEIKVSFLRPVMIETSTVTAHGRVTRRGKSARFFTAKMRDKNEGV
ncbi:hotdog domain-containing protein [Glutamicibacter sp. JC586]|uniref:hotdog domain-containing protein n=1 Tax=Glutamicibacter sp. JC586 TaxID=2590552 RepID=UPI001357F379|nr:hotdog domain-containing protein [Glutamicibacter sp. JC586]